MQCLVAYDKVTICSKAEVSLLVHIYFPSTMPCPKVAVLYRNRRIFFFTINHCCFFFSAPFLCFKLLKIIYLLQGWIKCAFISQVSVLLVAHTSICSSDERVVLVPWVRLRYLLGSDRMTSPLRECIEFIDSFAVFFSPSQEAVDELSIQKCLTLQCETVSDRQAREDHLLMQYGVQMLLLFLKLSE